MRILDVRTLHGPNVYHYKPMVLMELRLEGLANTTTAEQPEFVARLLRLLPGLAEHHCSEGRPGGFVKRLHEGTYFGHVVEHAAIELESMNGSTATHGKTRSAGRGGLYNIAVRFRSEHGMSYLLREAVELVDRLVAGLDFDLAPVMARYREISAETDLGPSTAAIAAAAESRGIPWRRLDDGALLQLGHGEHSRRVEAAVTDSTSEIAVELVGDKARTKSLLHEAGIPVPRGGQARTLAEALELFAEIGSPAVVKPLDGNKGKGVSVGVRSAPELETAFAKAMRFSGSALVEEELGGRDYRVLVVNGKLVAASERRPPQVEGDGASTLKQLIDALNQDPRRGEDHELPLTKVRKDPELLGHLKAQGLELGSVPGRGEVVRLRANANLSGGATASDVTDVVHPVTQRICERAASLVGLDICGVDLVTSDISQPLDGGVLELNASPGLRMHLAPSVGSPRDVGGAIVDGLFPPGTSARVPICAITGTNGKTTVTRLIAHLAGVGGANVGMTSTDGIHIGADVVRRGDLTGAASARSVLSDPSVQLAVLETARGGILRRGLGYDWSDVAVITNISADHFGQDGIETIEDLVWIKSLVAERVRSGGVLVLNADDAGSLQVASLERVDVGRLELVLFGKDPGSDVMAAHLQAGGRGYFVRAGWVVEAGGGHESSVARLADVRLTQGAAGFQVENVLAATAAARALGVKLEDVATGLATFSAAQNPGRVNMYKHGRGYVLVDYGHNEAALRAIGELLARWNGELVGIVGVPGDRTNELIERSARIVARYFPRVVLREDDDLRGRRRGEAIGLMRAAIREAAPAVRLDVVPNGLEALAGLLGEVADGAVVALFYERLDEVVRLLESVGAMAVDGLPAAQGGQDDGAAPRDYARPFDPMRLS